MPPMHMACHDGEPCQAAGCMEREPYLCGPYVNSHLAVQPESKAHVICRVSFTKVRVDFQHNVALPLFCCPAV